jgi:hypothetical protein
MGIATATETKMLNHEYRTDTYTKPTNRYLALFESDPGEAGTLTSEVSTSGSGYARVAIPCDDAEWTAPSDDGSGLQYIENASQIDFAGPVTADWRGGAPIAFWAMVTTASGAGDVIDYGPITSPFVVLNGNTPPSVAAGDLVIKRG